MSVGTVVRSSGMTSPLRSIGRPRCAAAAGRTGSPTADTLCTSASTSAGFGTSEFSDNTADTPVSVSAMLLTSPTSTPR